jgi:uncharacterized protein with PQ loop repeat
MFTQFLGTVATVYGVLGALKTLLQTRQMLARRTSRGVSAGFLASYAGGYAIWLAYGLSTGSLPLIVVDTVGLFCAGLTLAVALSLRGSPSRPAASNRRNTTAIAHRPAAPDPQPHTLLALGARWTVSARNQAAQEVLSRFVAARTATMTVIVQRAAQRGDLPDGTDATEVLQIVTAEIYYRVFIAGEQPSQALADRAAATAARANVPSHRPHS